MSGELEKRASDRFRVRAFDLIGELKVVCR
jgi:hypothetical protein